MSIFPVASISTRSLSGFWLQLDYHWRYLVKTGNNRITEFQKINHTFQHVSSRRVFFFSFLLNLFLSPARGILNFLALSPLNYRKWFSFSFHCRVAKRQKQKRTKHHKVKTDGVVFPTTRPPLCISTGEQVIESLRCTCLYRWGHRKLSFKIRADGVGLRGRCWILWYCCRPQRKIKK